MSASDSEPNGSDKVKAIVASIASGDSLVMLNRPMGPEDIAMAVSASVVSMMNNVVATEDDDTKADLMGVMNSLSEDGSPIAQIIMKALERVKEESES